MAPGRSPPTSSRSSSRFPTQRSPPSSAIPVAWSPLYRLGGATLLIHAGTLLLAPEYRRSAFALFAIGVASHFVLDLLLLTSTGYAFPVFWPLTEWRPPAGNLYLSSDRWPAAIAMLLATVVWYARYRVWNGQDLDMV